MNFSIVDNRSYRSVLSCLRSIHEAGESTGYYIPSSFIIWAFYIVKYSAHVSKQYYGRIYNRPTNIVSFRNCLDSTPIIVAHFSIVYSFKIQFLCRQSFMYHKALKHKQMLTQPFSFFYSSLTLPRT